MNGERRFSFIQVSIPPRLVEPYGVTNCKNNMWSLYFLLQDDRYFLSGSLDGKIRLWNIPDKKVALWNELEGSGMETYFAMILPRRAVSSRVSYLF